MTKPLNELGLAEATEAISARKLGSFDLVSSCLERINQREPQVGAWIYLDQEYALEQARQADRKQGRG